MGLHLYMAFVAAVAVLIAIPGPNVALIVANSVSHGWRSGLLTVAGTSSAMVLQLAFTVFGLGTMLGVLANGFSWLRWIGVAYLLVLGARAWTAPPLDLTAVTAEPRRVRVILTRAFLVSLTNPKTLLFYSAFLPQFIDPAAPSSGQLLLLAGTFLTVAVLLDSGWALLATRLRSVLALNGRLRNKLTGGMLWGAGLGLALARTP